MPRDAADVAMDEMLGRGVSPLGRVRPESNRLPGQDVSPDDAAASNLIAKALRALADGDDPRADLVIARATRLPYNVYEEYWPGLWAASMTLFDAVVDAMEESDDEAWLHAAFVVLDRSEPVAAQMLEEVLRIVRQDYGLSRSEHKAVTRQLGAAGPAREGLCDPWGPDESPAVLATATRSVLEAVLQYHRELASFA
jgi:hypothetical protein